MNSEETSFIARTVGNPLIDAVAQVLRHRPADPIEFIAQHLYHHRATHQECPEERHDGEQAAAVDSAENAGPADMSSPGAETSQFPAAFPCLSAKCNSKWPIHCYGKFNEGEFNVNSKYGGGAALMQISCSYGGAGADTSAEVFFLRLGFDCNHVNWESIVKSNHGHFGCENTIVTDEEGNLHPDCMFGTNDITTISNNPIHGNNSHGVVVKGEDGASVRLPITANGGTGAGCTLVIVTGLESGAGDAKVMSAVYMIRSGHKDDHIQTKLAHGEDKWKFEVVDGSVTASGPNKSSYGVYHNRDNLVKDVVTAGQAAAFHSQTASGDAETVVMKQIKGKFSVVVLCSTSSGAEDDTSAAMYMLTVRDNEVDTSLIRASRCEDVWNFKVTNDDIVAVGPAGPTRYAVVSNLPASGSTSIIGSFGCLATGGEQPVHGEVAVTQEGITGCVSQPSDIVIKINEAVIARYSAKELKASRGKLEFKREFSAKEKQPGLYLFRAYAAQPHTQDGKERLIELSGSPYQLIYQPKGVVFALNCSGPAYQAINDIVYDSEFKLVANFDHSFTFGTRYKCLGGRRTCATSPHVVYKTHDGFMYYSARTTGVEPEDEHVIIYKVENLPNKRLTARVHSCSDKFGQFKLNEVDLSPQVAEQFKKIVQVMSGYTALTAEVPIKVKDGCLDTYMKSTSLCAIALLDDNYKEKQQTEEEKQRDREEKQKLIDLIEPLNRTMFRKQRKTIGWSPNLIQNVSGEAGGMNFWNTSGDFKVIEGGYGHEKCFATSHMWCTKYQEIDLTEHFAAEYLDTAPAIEVFEWYREGVGGGGFYKFRAYIMNGDGKIIDEYKTDEIGRIYRNNKWEQEKILFQNYGPGVRRVAMETSGKDDKYWGGHYGALMSASTIRVKREAQTAEGDCFADVFEDDDKVRTSNRDKLIARVLADNEPLLKEIIEDRVIPEVDSSFAKQTESALPPSSRKRRKKREIRVFVSSTFRDFKAEREELIKKTFREINAACTERGVFFTYVDLRWGITEEQTNTGKTVAICLQEIDRCRPYFVCLLGERFGWCQKTEENQDELLNQSFDYAIKQDPKGLGWVEDHRYGSSVTKLEVLHGVLNRIEERSPRSFFYLRAPVQTGDVEPKQLKAMQPESDWHKEQQYALRSSVRDLDNVLNVRDFKAAKEACELIKKDLMWCLDQDFPAGTELSMLEKEREAHNAFADARCRVYIGRQEYFNQINEFMGKDTRKPLVILGESGSGKSALVANWTRKIEEQNPDAFVFVHFIGSSAESASYIKLLRRLMEEMKNHFRFSIPVPATDANLVRDLPVWLRMAGTFGKCFIVFDALNQLDDGSGQEGNEHDLLWIPRELPGGVSVLLSTLPGRAFDAVTSFGWDSMKVSPLAPNEKMDIVIGYMEGIYGKTLAQDQKDMIVSAEQTNNPLYLKALLDEVRVYGNFRTLTAKIEEYLVAANPGDLFAKILERLEGDFENTEQSSVGLVEKTTAAIWCSHKGMSEAEILELLQLPSAVWSPFYLSLFENLVNRNGILNFFHDHLRQAVEKKYLPTDSDKKKGYLNLANFFASQPINDRVVEELPWLLAKAGELERLKATISDLEVFRRMVKSEEGKFDLIKSWTLLGDFSQVDVAYKEALAKFPVDQQNTEKHDDLQQNLAEFFIDLGLYDAAKSMLEKLLVSLEAKFKESHGTIVYNPFNHRRHYKCTHDSVIDLLLNLGTVCQKQKEFENAKKYFTDVIERQNRVTTPKQKLKLCESLIGQATVLFSIDDLISAKKYLVRARELATDVLGPRHHYVAAIIYQLGQLTYKQDRLDEALGYLLQDLKLTRGEVGTSHLRMGYILNDVGLAYDDKNDANAGRLYESALGIFLDTYGPSHLDVALTRYNLGSFYFATNFFARAKYQFTEALQVYEAFLGPDHPDTELTRVALDEVSSFAK